jgi:hypothetical protein
VDSLVSLVDCRSNYTNILSIYNGIDQYLIEADKQFCSTACPCKVTTSKYATNTTWVPYFLNWVQDPLNGATNFVACSEDSKAAAYNAAIKIDPRLDNDQTFNATGFAKAFSWIETTFSCTGWCTKQYTDSKGQTIPLFKYLYSDINL